MDGGLTYRQRAVLLALQRDERMSYRELAEAAGIAASWSQVGRYLAVLEQCGYVEPDRRSRVRSIRLTEAGRAYGRRS